MSFPTLKIKTRIQCLEVQIQVQKPYQAAATCHNPDQFTVEKKREWRHQHMQQYYIKQHKEDHKGIGEKEYEQD